MECHNFESPISTLKVDLGCSKGCPTELKNMLQQLKGVKSISIDPNEGTLTVEGNINPMMLLKLLKKMGKRAHLWSFDKSSMQSRSSSSHPKPKHKETSHYCCRESNDSEDDSNEDYSVTWREHTRKHKAPNGQSSNKKSNGYEEECLCFGNRNAVPPPPPPPPVTGYYPPLMPMPMSWYQCQYQQPVAYGAPLNYATPPPPPAAAEPWYCGGYYGQGQNQPVFPNYYRNFGSSLLPKYNPMIHYTSHADNYRYTV